MALPKKGLGRGIDALMMSSKFAGADESSKISEIAIDDIFPNPDQPRKSFDADALENLSKSIREHGIVQPIIVKKIDGKYMIIAGERRYRASIMADALKVPCIVVNYDDATVSKISLIENIQREDLSIVEEANAYQRLIDSYSLTQDELAEAVGKSRSHIANTLRLLKLSDDVLELVQSGKISGGHARALLRISDDKKRLQLAEMIVEHELSVRDIENLAKKEEDGSKSADTPKTSKSKAKKAPEIKKVEERLEDLFSTKVAIKNGKVSGKIEIEYYSNEDLDRILKLML